MHGSWVWLVAADEEASHGTAAVRDRVWVVRAHLEHLDCFASVALLCEREPRPAHVLATRDQVATLLERVGRKGGDDATHVDTRVHEPLGAYLERWSALQALAWVAGSSQIDVSELLAHQKTADFVDELQHVGLNELFHENEIPSRELIATITYNLNKNNIWRWKFDKCIDIIRGIS